jgi:glutaryl-CoA dehydrogenase
VTGVVEKGTPGFSASKMQDKIALQVVHNAHILDGVRVPEANCGEALAATAGGHCRRSPLALVKAFCTVRMRETVGYARELLGGNGILPENQVGRFDADVEATYSDEGTRQINTLIVGRAITGTSAFV